MPAKTPAAVLTEFLSTVKGTRRCSVCRNPAIAEIVEAHLDKLRDGETSVTLRYVHDRLLLELGGPKSWETIHSHSRRCLRRDPSTGEEL